MKPRTVYALITGERIHDHVLIFDLDKTRALKLRDICSQHNIGEAVVDLREYEVRRVAAFEAQPTAGYVSPHLAERFTDGYDPHAESEIEPDQITLGALHVGKGGQISIELVDYEGTHWTEGLDLNKILDSDPSLKKARDAIKAIQAEQAALARDFRAEGNEDIARCDNCGWVGLADDTEPCSDIEERMGEPGDEFIVPTGDCPECGAFCFPFEEVVDD